MEINKSNLPLFIVDDKSEKGVFEISKKVARDFKTVAGLDVEIHEGYDNLDNTNYQTAILFVQGENERLKEYVDFSKIAGKREVYSITLSENPTGLLGKFNEVLIVAGSDKRGTIYGMFHLSELIGVSPLVFWGDAVPYPQDHITFSKDVEMISKEPSVEYRGFFINDEWPCFGNWTFSHYDGFTAEMYDKVFELLLRLKGNYMWPAMWSSSFALDGPDEKNAELADLYGVIIGNSHHEPCLRAGEEWDIYKGEDTIYKTEWNYLTNKDGLLNFWRDGLKRSGKYESIITVGMRGERDSILQGPNSLSENIEVLKDIITEQKKLIQKYGIKNGVVQPQLLAIYKEVEKYYYGDEATPGLKEWDGLKDIILMFCEDNFGHMRYLPELDDDHKGGYGMYYHLDYHGDPISYEWINSTPLSHIWEQMTIAYTHNIKKVWIVNVGDLKGNEFPLSYFMDLAYDFEKWGSNNIDSAKEYTSIWLQQQFGKWLKLDFLEELETVITDAMLLIGKRRPEALDEKTYDPFREGELILRQINKLERSLNNIEETIPEECIIGFYSMIADSLRMGLNLIKMQIYTGRNHFYASQGKTIANEYSKLIQNCIETDKKLIETAGNRTDGKWKGMWNTSHIGFKKWNEDGCRYPIRMNIEPFNRPRMILSQQGKIKIFQKNYGNYDIMEIEDFVSNKETSVVIEIANDGIDKFTFTIETENCNWLSYKVSDYTVGTQEYVTLKLDPNFMDELPEYGIMRFSADDVTIEVKIYSPKHINRTVFPSSYTEILAKDYVYASEDIITLHKFGRYDSGVKACPFVPVLKNEQILGYNINGFTEGEYNMILHWAPSNPVSRNHSLSFDYKIDYYGKWNSAKVLPDNYQAGEAIDRNWAKGVITQEHVTEHSIMLEEGENNLEIRLKNGLLVLEKIEIIKKK